MVKATLNSGVVLISSDFNSKVQFFKTKDVVS